MKRSVTVQISIAFIAGIVLIALAQAWARSASVWEQLDLVVDVRHQLISNYVESPNQRELVEAAVRGMIDSLDDPYTVLIDDVSMFERQVSGTFSGIGAEVDLFENRLRIVTPLQDSPAWQAGVLAGDIVLEINGETTQDMTLDKAIDLLTGEAGTEVTIRVRHRSGEEQTLTIVRDVINVQTVRGFTRDAENNYSYWIDPEQKIAYVRLTQFTGSTAGDLRDVLETLQAEDAQGLILDMRFNPGGMLDAAVEVSNLFLGNGQRIVSVKGRNSPEQVYTADDAGTVMAETPIVVLANEGSASASEIVAGALSDNDRALFVGSRTFGKGSVQTIRQLMDGSLALKLTTAYYYLPSGRNIHRRPDEDVWGVDPSEGNYVPMSTQQVREMIEIRRENERMHNGDNYEAHGILTPDRIETELKDLQLAAALKAMSHYLQAGGWPQVGENNTEQLVIERKREQLLAQKASIEEALQQVLDELKAVDEGISEDVDPEKVADTLRDALDEHESVPDEGGVIEIED